MKMKKKARRKPKKFRFQLLHKFLLENYKPCRAADIGGGKGLLAYMLVQSGWKAVVIDPEKQRLPLKYTDLEKKRVRIPADAEVPMISKPFGIDMAKEFDLLIGLHAHGCNMAIIDACKIYRKKFVLIPCCLHETGEPVVKEPGHDWFDSLVEYAQKQGFSPKTYELNFKGKNKIIFVK